MANKSTTSINIIRDSNRDLHYITTPNATRVVNQICDDFRKGTRSFNIIGSYGTGKSSFLLAFEQSVLGLKKHFSINILSDPTATFINFVGEYKSLQSTFAEHFNVKSNSNVDENIFSEIFNRYYDLGSNNPLLFIVIDEFGKFLEYATQNAPEKELYFIQKLAEFVNNPDNNIVLITTVHQNFDAYTVGLTTSQKQEWTKVKGRFVEIGFNEPVEQLLFLASEYLDKRASAKIAKKEIENTIDLFIKSKVFNTNLNYVNEIAEKLYPLDIISSNIVTMSLQKYGQNERSLFSFLESTDSTSIVYHTLESNHFYSISNVYDYLIFNFYSFINSKYNPDFSLWQSIKSALEHVERAFDKNINDYRSIVKIIGLLNIFGSKGAVLDKQFLIDYSRLCASVNNADVLLDELALKQIILYRNYSKQFVLFEGTDLDIPSALIEAGNKVSDVTDITTLLNKYYQLPPIVAKEETYKRGTPRLFEYCISVDPIHKTPKNEIDGFINLIFNDKLKLSDVLEQSKSEEQAILYGYYKNSKVIKDLLFEIEKTRKVIEENNDDVFAKKELNLILTHQKNLLNHKILNNFYASHKEVVWVFNGKEYPVASKKEFNKLLSRISSIIYYKAPVFNNELVNKHKISASIHTARKNFYKALYNNWDKVDLGFPKEKFPPEKTIFLSLLKNNGIELYSDELDKIEVNENNNFHLLWEASLAFLNTAKISRRKISELNDILSLKPFKLKQGLIDFWVPAFLFINRDNYALFNSKGYIPFINDEVLDLITKYPEEFEVKTFAIEGVKLDLFNSYRLFLDQDTKEKLSNNGFIETIKPFLTFYRSLPEYSQNTKRLSAEAIAIRTAIANSKDPEQTFFEDFPNALGFSVDRLQNSKDDLQSYVIKLQDAIRDLRTCFDELLNRVELFIQTDIIAEEIPFDEYKDRLQKRFKKLRKHLLLPAEKTFILRLDSQLEDKRAWLNSIVQALCGVTLEKLKDEDEIAFYHKFKAMILNLDSLTTLSKSDFSEDKEDVVSLEINTFFEGINKKLVRLPKSKKEAVIGIENTLRNQLSDDATLNIAALTNLLRELLKNG